MIAVDTNLLVRAGPHEARLGEAAFAPTPLDQLNVVSLCPSFL